jgi:hypothetical protein
MGEICMKLFGKILAYMGYSIGAIVAAVMEFMPDSIDKTAGTVIIITGAFSGIGIFINTILKTRNIKLDNKIKNQQLIELQKKNRE